MDTKLILAISLFAGLLMGVISITPDDVFAEAENDLLCFDFIDNDGDGLIDNADPDCFGEFGPRCFDSIDNEADGLTDQSDPDCINSINPVFIPEPTCDSPPSVTLTIELTDVFQYLPFSEIAFTDSFVHTTTTVCVPDDGDPNNDFEISITNIISKSFYNLFFVADCPTVVCDPVSSFPIGNVDGVIREGDAFKIDSVGINSNLISESITSDGIFEPGETWTFLVTNLGPPGNGLNPERFGSFGVGGDSCSGFIFCNDFDLPAPLSFASILAREFIDLDDDGIPDDIDNIDNRICGPGTIADDDLGQCVAVVAPEVSCGDGTVLDGNECVVDPVITQDLEDANDLIDDLEDFIVDMQAEIQSLLDSIAKVISEFP